MRQSGQHPSDTQKSLQALHAGHIGSRDLSLLLKIPILVSQLTLWRWAKSVQDIAGHVFIMRSHFLVVLERTQWAASHGTLRPAKDAQTGSNASYDQAAISGEEYLKV